MRGTQTALIVCKLRRNIIPEGDLVLAERELAAFVPERPERIADLGALARRLPELGDLAGHGELAADVRPAGPQGFFCEAPLERLADLVRRLSFAARLYALTADTPAARDWLSGAESALGPVFSADRAGDSLRIQALPHNLLLELSEVVVRRARSPEQVSDLMDALVAGLLGRDAPGAPPDLVARGLAARQTTSHLFHDLHYYKAKFFPRLARSTLNVCDRRLAPGPRRVLDPMAGSGTALLEAALLGLPSEGYDLDPLSVLIARAKLDALDAAPGAIRRQAERALDVLNRPSNGRHDRVELRFPAWLTRNRRFTPEVGRQLTGEIHEARGLLAACDPAWLGFFRVLVSDAMSRRIRLRLLGTGVGRFSLGLSAASVGQHLGKTLLRLGRVAAASVWLQSRLCLDPARATVAEGDARKLPDTAVDFDILLTSPPYLPASSGRESYAKARALSFLALDLLERDGIDDLASEAIGSMAGNGTALADLSPPERDVVAWLAADELRAIKAEPTARYFLDLRAVFGQMRRVLVPGGIAVVVCGRQSTFYQFSTRRALYVVESAKLLAQCAGTAGLEVEELLDVQLVKSNMNARPRALDDYYETLVVLRRP